MLFVRSTSLASVVFVSALLLVACGDDGSSAGGSTANTGGSGAQAPGEGGAPVAGAAQGGQSQGGQSAGGAGAGGEAAGGGGPTPDPSPGCGQASPYPVGASSEDTLAHDGLDRTFRVHLPPGYDLDTPTPVVVMLHGGGGSGLQLEDASSNMSAVADSEGFIAVYPDGTGLFKTWNGGGCCGSAVTNDIDDVGFIAALLDNLEASLCVDRRRVFASGMSNGGIMTHRLSCELSERFAAFAPVAGAEMAPSCAPSEPRPLMHIHGSSDGHVPPAGGLGCGPAGVPFPPLAETMEARRVLNGCDAETAVAFTAGDGTCAAYQGCEADVMLCMIAGGGHSWPGGEPPADVVDCPADGPQSTTFIASEQIWAFFADHPKP